MNTNTGLFQTASHYPQTSSHPNDLLTSFNICRGQLPSGTKMDSDKLALQGGREIRVYQAPRDPTCLPGHVNRSFSSLSLKLNMSSSFFLFLFQVNVPPFFHSFYSTRPPNLPTLSSQQSKRVIFSRCKSNPTTSLLIESFSSFENKI